MLINYILIVMLTAIIVVAIFYLADMYTEKKQIDNAIATDVSFIRPKATVSEGRIHGTGGMECLNDHLGGGV